MVDICECVFGSMKRITMDSNELGANTITPYNRTRAYPYDVMPAAKNMRHAPLHRPLNQLVVRTVPEQLQWRYHVVYA